jgi:ribonucleoside-diphosphate reductase alpha chain
MGIGIQALAETFVLMGFGYDSEDARVLNEQIAEAVYYAAVDESANLIRIFGTYSSFKESPMSQGAFQFDLCETSPDYRTYDWGHLHKKVVKGMANSVLVSYMPTEDASKLTGCTSLFDPMIRPCSFARLCTPFLQY